MLRRTWRAADPGGHPLANALHRGVEMPKLKVVVWAVLALMAGAYALPYNYFRSSYSETLIGTWGA
jgi:hypothetical protein